MLATLTLATVARDSSAKSNAIHFPIVVHNDKRRVLPLCFTGLFKNTPCIGIPPRVHSVHDSAIPQVQVGTVLKC